MDACWGRSHAPCAATSNGRLPLPIFGIDTTAGSWPGTGRATNASSSRAEGSERTAAAPALVGTPALADTPTLVGTPALAQLSGAEMNAAAFSKHRRHTDARRATTILPLSKSSANLARG